MGELVTFDELLNDEILTRICFLHKKYYYYNKVVFRFLLVSRWVGDARIRFISLFEGLDWPLAGAQ